MELIETTTVADGVLPVEAFRDHLRLGTGFADESSLDEALLAYLRAAIATIEGRTGKALIRRNFRLELVRWRWADSQTLPVSPVSEVDGMTVRDASGVGMPVDAARWRLEADSQRPRIVASGAVLPQIPLGGRAEIDFQAGFGQDWADVPADLAQAVFLLAAQYFADRTGGAPALPVSVSVLLARWMPMRLGTGGGTR